MLSVPDVPVAEIELFIFKVAAVASTVIFTVKYLGHELRRPKCHFCGQAVSSKEQSRTVIVVAHERCVLRHVKL